MTSERRHRHVLDELLSRSVQAPPRRSQRPTAAAAPESPGWAIEPPDEDPPSVRAPKPRSAAVGLAPQETDAMTAGARHGDRIAGPPDASGPPPVARAPIIRNARASEQRPRAHEEVQVGRGALALHLSKAATEERLAQAGERLEETERRLGEAGARLGELERHLTEAQGRLTQTEGRLAEARKHVLATEERLAMTEESERHAREEQARSEQSRQALAAQLREREQHESGLRLELGSERNARTRAELDLERLRGSVAALGPIVSGIDRATAEIRSLALAHARPADAPGQAPAAVADAGSEPRAAAGSGSEGGHPGAGDHAAHARTGEDQRAGEAAGAIASAPPPPGGGLVRALADAVEHWRGPGPRPGQQ